MLNRRSLLKGLGALLSLSTLGPISVLNDVPKIKPDVFIPHPLDGNGYLFPNGRVMPRNRYPQLFKMLGYSYGRTVNDDFKLPDFGKPMNPTLVLLSENKAGAPVGALLHIWRETNG